VDRSQLTREDSEEIEAVRSHILGITIPLHDEIAKGTLNDILSKVSLWKGIPKDELIRSLKK